MDNTATPSVFSNVITGSDYYTGLIEAAQAASAILHRHCGPFAANAVRAIGIGNGVEIDEFTKDGITIMQACRTTTPQSEFVKRLLTFVGQRVDSICHDGTTTSMMFFAQCIEHISAFTKDCPDSDRLTAAAVCKSLLDTMSEKIEASCVTLPELHSKIRTVRPKQTLQETKRALAYHQAMVSSKGDTELASAISDVVASIPVEMFGSYVINNETFETEKRFRVVQQEFDIGFRSNLGHQDFNNVERGTELKYDDASLIFTSACIVKGSPVSSFIKALLSTPKMLETMEKLNKHRLLTPDDDRFMFNLKPDENYITGPLVIIAPEISDAVLSDMVNIYRRLYPDTPVVYTTIQNSVRLRQFYESAVSATAGVYPVMDTIHTADSLASIIPHVKVEIRHSYCMFSNLYKKDKHAFHPFYRNKKKFPFYTTVLNEVITKITQFDKGHVETMSKSDIQELIMLYRMMCCQKIIDLKVGGTSHDLAANMSVASDAYGAALSSIKDGVVLGGYPKILAAIRDRHVTVSVGAGVEETSHATVSNRLIFAMACAVSGVLKSIYRTGVNPRAWADDVYGDATERLSLGEKWTYLTPQRSKITGAYVHASVPREVLEDEWIESFLHPENNGEVVLFQPIVGYREQFRRLLDVLPKLINSSCILDHGVDR